MKLRQTILSLSAGGYKDGLKDGKESERERILKLVAAYGLNNNAYPYFLDVIKLIEGDKN